MVQAGAKSAIILKPVCVPADSASLALIAYRPASVSLLPMPAKQHAEKWNLLRIPDLGINLPQHGASSRPLSFKAINSAI